MGSYESTSASISLGYIDPSDSAAKDCRQMMDAFYQCHYPGNAAYWMQGSIDKRFKVGDQNFYSQFYGAQQNQYQKYCINLIRRHLSMITGYQRRNRRSTVVVPMQPNTDALCDDYNKCLRWDEDRDNFQETNSEAFAEACDVGEDLLHLTLRYDHDIISGDLHAERVGYNNYLIDTYTREPDLSDCNGVWIRQWLSKQAAKMYLPGYQEIIDKMKPNGMKDGRFPLQAELQNISISNLFTYDEFYYRSTRKVKVIIDTQSNESTIWQQEQDEPEDILDRILFEQPWLKIQDREIPTVKLCIAIGGQTVYNGPNKLGIDIYPFVPVRCYYEKDIQSYAWRKQGIVRGARDLQVLYNMRTVAELQILQSSINAGWIYPIDAVVDPKAFRQSGPGEGFLIPLKAGRAVSEVQRIDPVGIPQTIIEMRRILADDISKVLGTNEELLGAAVDDKPGIVSMLRQGAGLTTLQAIYDRLDLAQRLFGRLRLLAMIKNYNKTKISKILGKEPEQGFFAYNNHRYNIAVEEGVYSTTQRQMVLQQLLEFKKLGMEISDKSIIDAAYLIDKAKIKQEMEESAAQMQQQQQAQSDQQAKLDNAKIMQAFAKSKADLAIADERKAKIDQIEADAEQKSTQSDLDLVKTLIALEDMDLENMRRNVELAAYIKGMNTQMNSMQEMQRNQQEVKYEQTY